MTDPKSNNPTPDDDEKPELTAEQIVDLATGKHSDIDDIINQATGH